MAQYTIYHNPRCSKSRQTLALLEHAGIEPRVVKYLETPPDADTLRALITRLGLGSAHELVRSNEAEYREAGLSPSSDDETVIEALVRYPKLLQRPVVVKGERAVIGRPPENVHDLIGKP